MWLGLELLLGLGLILRLRLDVGLGVSFRVWVNVMVGQVLCLGAVRELLALGFEVRLCLVL